LETNEAASYVDAAAPEVPEVAVPIGLSSGELEFDESSTTTAELTELENQAHTQRVLLSSDAMRYFVAKVPVAQKRSNALDRVIAKARVTFPSENGWVVINLVRMEQLIEEVDAERDELVADERVDLTEAVRPITSGSLAEAIITGNVVAAYEMISHRPMVALADATADLDALYRYRKGEEAVVSELLKSESIRLSNEKLQDAIMALTSALDGTYTDEASAVKMAIMKAVKAVA
jgi:hypothetical protein